MKIPKRIAQALLNSLKGGVVPRVGLPYIAVGRKEEIDALLHDVDIIAEGGASFRFLVGKYGSGKSFLLQTIRNYVMAKNFVVVDADLSPERRLQGTRGQGLATYKELCPGLFWPWAGCTAMKNRGTMEKRRPTMPGSRSWLPPFGNGMGRSNAGSF